MTGAAGPCSLFPRSVCPHRGPRQGGGSSLADALRLGFARARCACHVNHSRGRLCYVSRPRAAVLHSDPHPGPHLRREKGAGEQEKKASREAAGRGFRSLTLRGSDFHGQDALVTRITAGGGCATQPEASVLHVTARGGYGTGMLLPVVTSSTLRSPRMMRMVDASSIQRIRTAEWSPGLTVAPKYSGARPSIMSLR